MSLEQQWIFEADRGSPAEKEIRNIWAMMEFGNDNYYFSWDADKEWWGDDDEGEITYAQRFPEIHKVLSEQNVTECLIHFWW